MSLSDKKDIGNPQYAEYYEKDVKEAVKELLRIKGIITPHDINEIFGKELCNDSLSTVSEPEDQE